MSSRRFLLASVVVFIVGPALAADDWPQWLGPKRDGVWRETGIIDKFGPKGAKEVWRTPIGAGYSGPAVAAGRVYITDSIHDKGAKDPESGFTKSKASGVERVLCLDQKTGEILWKYEYRTKYNISYAAGPRTTPAVDGDRVYALGAMGDLVCLRVKDGEKVWHRKLLEDYGFDPPLWGFSAHPLVDGDRLISLVGGKGSVVVAFDKMTGKELWKKLSANEPGYCPPMIYEVDGLRQLIIWDPAGINSLNPETGAVYWSHPFFAKPGKTLKAALSIPTPRLDGHNLFFTAFYDGPLMLRLKGKEKPTVVWRGKGTGETPEKTDGLHAIMVTPTIKDGHIYGVCSYGELRCLKEETGERIWETHAATTGKSVRWGNAFMVEQGDRFILFNEGGDLIIARLTPKGYDEISRAHILEPTNTNAPPPGRRVIWSHPAFAGKCVFARNDREIVCVSMAQE
ncbi:MAG: PQQ-binding-like beta-propeller repeat protein [Gemmataceae bacterium]